VIVGSGRRRRCTVIMVDGVMVVRRHGRGRVVMARSPMVRSGGSIRQLQTGLPRRATGNERNRDGPNQNVAKDPTHRLMLAEAKLESHWTADCVPNVVESLPTSNWPLRCGHAPRAAVSSAVKLPARRVTGKANRGALSAKPSRDHVSRSRIIPSWQE
jgi:hypothetical protein